MAPTIAIAIGRGPGKENKGTRPGADQSEAQANTRYTFATAKINADGSGEIRVERIIEGDRTVLGFIKFGPENREDCREVEFNVREARWISRGSWSTQPRLEEDETPAILDSIDRALSHATESRENPRPADTPEWFSIVRHAPEVC